MMTCARFSGLGLLFVCGHEQNQCIAMQLQLNVPNEY